MYLCSMPVEEYGAIVERFQTWLDAGLPEIYRTHFEERGRARALMRQKRKVAKPSNE